jgi:hypothetical protein
MAFLMHLMRARMVNVSHVAPIALQKGTALCARALPARSLRARSVHPLLRGSETVSPWAHNPEIAGSTPALATTLEAA